MSGCGSFVACGVSAIRSGLPFGRSTIESAIRQVIKLRLISLRLINLHLKSKGMHSKRALVREVPSVFQSLAKFVAFFTSHV